MLTAAAAKQPDATFHYPNFRSYARDFFAAQKLPPDYVDAVEIGYLGKEEIKILAFIESMRALLAEKKLLPSDPVNVELNNFSKKFYDLYKHPKLNQELLGGQLLKVQNRFFKEDKTIHSSLTSPFFTTQGWCSTYCVLVAFGFFTNMWSDIEATLKKISTYTEESKLDEATLVEFKTIVCLVSNFYAHDRSSSIGNVKRPQGDLNLFLPLKSTGTFASSLVKSDIEAIFQNALFLPEAKETKTPRMILCTVEKSKHDVHDTLVIKTSEGIFFQDPSNRTGLVKVNTAHDLCLLLFLANSISSDYMLIGLRAFGFDEKHDVLPNQYILRNAHVTQLNQMQEILCLAITIGAEESFAFWMARATALGPIDSGDYNPLTHIIRTGRRSSNLMKILSEYKVDIDAPDLGCTPLRMAVIMDDQDCANQLLARGANPFIDQPTTTPSYAQTNAMRKLISDAQLRWVDQKYVPHLATTTDLKALGETRDSLVALHKRAESFEVKNKIFDMTNKINTILTPMTVSHLAAAKKTSEEKKRKLAKYDPTYFKAAKNDDDLGKDAVRDQQDNRPPKKHRRNPK